MSKSSGTVLMTEGSIGKHILTFAFPLFWGNLFQQLYNTADSLIVGNFLGNHALAAVSSSGNLIFLMVGLFQGISIGAGVVIARYFGARDLTNLKKAIHTTISFGLLCAAALTVIGVIAAPKILLLMGTPDEVLPNSLAYFRIYFAGSLGFVMYNCFTGILQSVGDSRHPLYFLIVSSLTNIVLDLLFIAVLGFGVGAAAFATILSQLLSSSLCLRQLMHGPEEIQVRLSEIRPDKLIISQIMKNGLPAGLQNSIISLANVFVQSNINRFGALAVAGCGSYSKIEGFAFIPVTCFAMALTTFTSQNLGARQYARAKKGAVFGILCGISVSELIGICIYFIIPKLLFAFGSTADAVAYGITQAQTVALFYFLMAFSHCMAGIMRGSGHAAVPMFVMMICWCIIRVTYISIIVRFIPSINVVFWAYPLTWTLSAVMLLIYFIKTDWVHGLE